MTVRQAALNPLLTLNQPVEHGKRFVSADFPKPHYGSKARARSLFRKPPGGGELRAGVEQTHDYGPQGDVPHARAFSVQHPIQPQPHGRAERGGHVSVGKRALYGKGFIYVFVDNSAFEHGSYAVNYMRGQMGEVAKGFLADAVSFAPGFAQEYGGSAFAVGYCVYVV